MAPIMLDSGEPLGTPSNDLGGKPIMANLDGKANHEDQDRLEPIAIVGYSFRFPGDATNSKAFWQMMMEKRCATSDTPEDRISISQWQHPDGKRRGQYSSQGGHYLKEDVSLFDAPFFSLSADEAAALDPQHRHLLEVTYRALENAGMPMEKVVGSQTSVHVGCFNSDYRLMACKDVEMTADYDVVGMQMSMNANRLSWFFDFRGTSMNIDTACSSSLIALDLACQGLRSGETDMGIVAGTNLILSADMMQAFSNVNMLSPDARCYSFDHRANGYGRGEGTGTLVIKRLADAIRDGDTIRAVIRSAGSNQDGLTPSGIMQPSGASQANLIRNTYARAGLSMGPTRFFEAHGTGTQVGDPIECNALGDAFRGFRTPDDPLYVGAVKSNIGHLEGASGIAAVIKTILVLESGLIPPNTNFEKINPKIDLEFLGLQLPHVPTPWPTIGLRRASVNSFGFGGSNSHVVLDDAYNYLRDHGLVGNHITVEYPPAPQALNDSSSQSDVSSLVDALSPTLPLPRLLVLSSASKTGIKQIAAAYKSYFESLEVSADKFGQYMADLAHSLNTRRSVLPYRSFWTASSLKDLLDVEKKATEACQIVEKPVLGFVFTGQGSQWAGMGRELLKYPAFRNSIWQCGHDLRSFGCLWSLQEEVLRDNATSRINDPEIAQPANTALQIALVDLFHSVGVKPAVAIGHSSGEIAAAYAAGVLSATESMRIAYFRGVCVAKLSKTQQPAGAMIAASLSEADALDCIDEVAKVHGRWGLQVACINSQKSVTIAGDEDQVDTLESLLTLRRTFARKLKVSVAYHSSHMKQIAPLYREQMSDLQPMENESHGCVMVSSVTGEKVASEELRLPQYWVDNLTSPVQFAQSLIKICTESGRKIKKKLDGSHRSQLGVNILLEIGPQATLQRPIRDLLETLSWGPDVNYLSAIRRGQNAASNLLDALGNLHCLGISVNFGRVNRLENPELKHARMLTDLPEYPFNHTTSYWRESRVSRRLRLANQGRLDLLGKPAIDWNPLEARWRHHIRISEMPWVEDHIINGTLIYPAAGMIVMAIEAANQVADPNQKIDGFQLRNVKFQRALTVPRTADGVETNLLLRTLTGGSSSSFPWLEFRLYSLDNDDTWQDNCHGFIKVQYHSTRDELREKSRQFEDCFQQDDWLSKYCDTTFSKERMYECLHGSGFQFGPTFQTVFNGKCSKENQARSSLKVFAWPANQHPQPHIVHPTTLDGILHLTAAALSEGGQIRVPTAVPTGIQSLWVAKEGLSYPSVDVIHGSTWAKSIHSRGHEFNICVMDEKRTRVLAKVDGLQSTIVADTPAHSVGNSDDKLTVHHLHHFPALDLLGTDRLVEYCAQSRPDGPEPLAYFRDVNFVLFKFLSDVLDNLGDSNSETVLPHIRRYIDWARVQRSKFEAGELPLSRPEWKSLLHDTDYFQSACDRLSTANAQGYAFIHTGSNLLSILRGEQDPIQFLWKDNMMSNFYRESNDRDGCFDSLGVYLRAHAQQKPAMRILEIGAGTGGTTAHILKALSQGSGISPGNPLYMSYDYTDISPAFFDNAAKRFKDFPRMNFRVLDIIDDLASQGFELESYDLVVAANALHATPDICATMRKVRKLLKPGGKVILFEITRPEIIRSGFCAGLMEGWWAGKNDNRIWSPAMPGARWDETFKSTGFSGVDMEIPEFLETECQENSILVTTASSNTPLQAPLEFYVVFDEGSTTQRRLYEQITERLKSQHPVSDILGGDLKRCISLPSLASTTLVFIQEMEKPFLYGMSENEFSQIKHAVADCTSILWVTGGGGHSPQRPEYSLVDGWARTLRAENVNLRMITLALDVDGQTRSDSVSHITRVLAHEMIDLKRTHYEPEFVEINGILNVTRVKPSKSLTDDLHEASLPCQSATMPLGDAGPVKLAYRTPGLLDTLHWTDGYEGLEQQIQADEVEINVSAVGLNFRDCEIALGKDPKTEFGQECSGTITRAGELSGYQPGDRVVSFGPGKFKTTVRSGVDSVCRIPHSLSLAEAASIPAQFGTSWHAIVGIARLQRDESILIHAGAGGTGQAAIQIAQYIGSKIYATTSTLEKKQTLTDVYNIPADHIFYSRDTSFAEEVMRQTKGCGIDVVVNTLASEILDASWECIANYGRLVDIGYRDSVSPMCLPMARPGRQASFTYFDSVDWMQERPANVKRALETIFNLFSEGKLHLHKQLHFESPSNLEDAFRLMQSGNVIGKLVLEISPEAHVPTILNAKAPFRLNANATYLVAGGLGGLGRAAARWMASRGAKHLVLLGRSGAKTRAALDLVDELDAQGVELKTPPCDVVDSTSVRRVIQEVYKTMPPIKGCIQGSMVLQDQPFERMSYNEWKMAVDCKVRGSWNLEMILPEDLDFFILFSSANGLLGIPSQSNYGSGNTYLDAFARYRVSKGKKAVSLDLGVMSDDGLLAETPEMLERVIGYGNGSLLPVSRPKFLGLLDHYCNPDRPLLTPETSQVVVGVAPGGDGFVGNTLLEKPLFSHLKLNNIVTDNTSKEVTVQFQRLFSEATSLEEGRDIVAKALINKLKHSYKVVPEDGEVDMHTPLHAFRIDSLLAVELCNWIRKEFAADLAVLEVMGGATLAMVDVLVATRSQLKHPEWV